MIYGKMLNKKYKCFADMVKPEREYPVIRIWKTIICLKMWNLESDKIGSRAKAY